MSVREEALFQGGSDAEDADSSCGTEAGRDSNRRLTYSQRTQEICTFTLQCHPATPPLMLCMVSHFSYGLPVPLLDSVTAAEDRDVGTVQETKTHRDMGNRDTELMGYRGAELMRPWGGGLGHTDWWRLQGTKAKRQW